jgi:hypothetical protein
LIRILGVYLGWHSRFPEPPFREAQQCVVARQALLKQRPNTWQRCGCRGVSHDVLPVSHVWPVGRFDQP